MVSLEVDVDGAEAAHGVDEQGATGVSHHFTDLADRVQDTRCGLAMNGCDMCDRGVVSDSLPNGERINRLGGRQLPDVRIDAEDVCHLAHARTVRSVVDYQKSARLRHERADHRFNRVGSAALNQDGLIPGRVRHAGKRQEASPYFLDQADELTVA